MMVSTNGHSLLLKAVVLALTTVVVSVSTYSAIAGVLDGRPIWAVGLAAVISIFFITLSVLVVGSVEYRRVGEQVRLPHHRVLHRRERNEFKLAEIRSAKIEARGRLGRMIVLELSDGSRAWSSADALPQSELILLLKHKIAYEDD